MNVSLVRKAMILAAGEGTRLRPLTQTMPKPMVPVANVPLLVRTLRLLRAHGVTDVAVNLYHRPESIRDALGDGSEYGVRLTYSDETTLLGTAGGVKKLEAFFDETFLLLYGDNLYDADFAPLIARHRSANALATIATFTAPNPSACGLVVTDAAGQVTRFQEKPPPDQVFTDQANAGVYVLEPSVLNLVPAATVYDWGKDVFPALLASQPGAMTAQPLNGYLQDTGTVPAYRQANWDALGGIGSGGQPVSGVDPTALVSPAATLDNRNVIGARTTVGDGAYLSECIVWDDCRIEGGANVQGAILGRGVSVGAAALVGDGAILADGATVAPGATVPGGAKIGPGETFSVP